MSEELFERAAILQKTVKDLKAELKENETELKEILDEIKRNQLASVAYSFEPATTPAREANAEWFFENYFDFYCQFAHVSNPVAISLMAEICGGYAELQKRLREGRPNEFRHNASINIKDIETAFSEDTIRYFERVGAIQRGEPKSYKVVPLPMYLVETRKQVAEAGGA